ncbi:hypothetical protein K493DRAFT_364013 [Basidiobolus meristosporus CBS 931.73]|uniref:Arrestin C-terminal-like domain-containing protein n=1 Tax=Basidiobolus meristosporus CBS 931.73 TaxID=1314790 RepID=A0A1Y1WQ74_9FUNG|nr:hypothetical protein K493DRAFT_364013 [Basidiobolus meristosporus CBS 931.73]|eukprot:ORX75683.1 hypothetical protein K493DRAFT_364013 [Basidiobolus meristosporus CBS 931.73]
MTITGNIKIEIKPIHDRVFLPYTRVSEVEHPVETTIQGKVLIHLKKALKVSSITLQLEGYLEEKAFGVKSLKLQGQRCLVKEKRMFLGSPASLQSLSAGSHVFDFSFNVSSELPETVCSPFLDIRYRLVAVLKKSGLSSKVKQVKDLSIYRTCDDFESDVYSAVTLANSWPKVMDYSVALPSKILTLGEIVPVEFHLWPHLKDIKFLGLEFSLVEDITYSGRNADGAANTKRWIGLKSTCTTHDNLAANKLVRVHIPNDTRVRCDINHELIQIRHKLEVRILFESHRKLNSITLRCLVVIQPEPEIEEDLPSYPQSFTNQLVEASNSEVESLEWANVPLPTYETILAQ